MIYSDSSEYQQLILKVRILECQWYKDNGDKRNCDICAHKFACFSMKSRRFTVYESRVTSHVSNLFAEDSDNAHDLYLEFAYDENIVYASNSQEAQEGEFEIEEVKHDGLR